MKNAVSLDTLLHDQTKGREARAEIWSGTLFAGTILVGFGVLSVVGAARELAAFHEFQMLVLCFLAWLGLLAILIAKDWWHPALRYVNTGAQVALLSIFLALMARDKGPSFAFSTAIPMLFCVPIAITAFRLSPLLTLFSGAAAASGMILVYAFAMRPQLSEAMLREFPTLSWPSVIARVVVLFSIGVAAALSALALRKTMRKNAEDEDRIDLLKRTFGRLVAPEVAREILANENWMQPARRDAVVMFADLKGFTSFSESRPPEEVAEFLNRCWSIAADIVEKHGGVINKYLGDGFLALFGVPAEHPEAERAAAETAAELEEKLGPLLGTQNLAICIGLHAGPMIFGGIGSESRCEFTVIGSTVNLASRIESLNRTLNSRCLTSQSVADKIVENWDLTHRGGQRVKGVSDEVSVFELRGRKPSP